jgi:cellulose synthase/poly-beta-1,6-N-acetylglucosamine synthase-like glycosyltransferase
MAGEGRLEGQAAVGSKIRPSVEGKFIFIGGEKFHLRGVTYGTFCPNENGEDYPDRALVERDFDQIAQNGLNAVRTYTVPPRWLLDAAQRHGLRVMVGIPWEQHVAFLDDAKRIRAIEERVRAGVRICAGHPAILGYAIGNEIPASIVRWYGHRRVERFLKRLYRAAKAEDPEGLVTYVNYPSTEYLQLPFIDFVCFNVYLETRERLDAYLARLQNIANERPLLIAELGLDSTRHEESTQAEVLDWQIRTAFAAGCAGAFVFAWTDEWYRGGHEILDWDFGLTRRDRYPKPALAAVRRAFAETPFPPDVRWPRISVVVCSYNGARTIRDSCEGLARLDYPNFEVIVVDDGSTDATAAIAREYGFRLISTENRGLSNARNTGMNAATGEIVAYIDDDAYPDPHWLTYLASTFLTTDHAGVGGPNIAPPGDGPIAECVANAPGNPLHVLLSDREAEHIPGCNMAFRKRCLQAIDGFDPQFRVAGDDVDVCWKLQQQGWTLGFSPAAVVWHHRRNSVRTYWKQQQGYGKAEALLENKWPEKYNIAGHLNWGGRIYQRFLNTFGWSQGRIYQGTWGSALFQFYQPTSSGFWSLMLMPEWYLIVLCLAVISILGVLWSPLLLFIPLLTFAAGVPLVQACLNAARATFAGPPRSRLAQAKLCVLTTLLHVMHPLARLRGRLRYKLTPWRRRGVGGLAVPRSRTFTLWSERWQDPHDRLQSIEADLKARRAIVLRGGDYDDWDLQVHDGTIGSVRVKMAVEEHGAGRQLVRFCSWPRCPGMSLLLMLAFAGLSAGAALDQVWVVSAILGLPALLLALLVAQDCAAATAVVLRALRAMEAEEQRSYASQELPAPELLQDSKPPREQEIPLVRAHSARTGGN